MDNLLTDTSANYSILFARYIFGRFTQYSGIHQNKVPAINGCQPIAVLLSSFIAASHF
jgi:hypothetical protein